MCTVTDAGMMEQEEGVMAQASFCTATQEGEKRLLSLTEGETNTHGKDGETR